MSCSRVFLCILLPPFAVADKGCGSVILVALLTLFGWVPGAIAALIICSSGKESGSSRSGGIEERASWAFHKATRKQIDYLIDLGAIKNPDVSLTQLEASRLIDKTVRWRESKRALIGFGVIVAGFLIACLFVTMRGTPSERGESNRRRVQTEPATPRKSEPAPPTVSDPLSTPSGPLSSQAKSKTSEPIVASPPQQTLAPDEKSAPAPKAAMPGYATIVKPCSLPVEYGTVGVPVGSVVKILGVSSNQVSIQYHSLKGEIPIESTDLNKE